MVGNIFSEIKEHFLVFKFKEKSDKYLKKKKIKIIKTNEQKVIIKFNRYITKSVYSLSEIEIFLNLSLKTKNKTSYDQHEFNIFMMHFVLNCCIIIEIKFRLIKFHTVNLINIIIS